MNTQCCSNNDQLELEFQGLNRKKIIGKFDGGYVTSAGGALLLCQATTRLSLRIDSLRNVTGDSCRYLCSRR